MEPPLNPIQQSESPDNNAHVGRLSDDGVITREVRLAIHDLVLPPAVLLAQVQALQTELRYIGKPPPSIPEIEKAAAILSSVQTEGLKDFEQRREIERFFRNCCGQYATVAALTALGQESNIIDMIEKHNSAGIFSSPRSVKEMLTYTAPDGKEIKPMSLNYKLDFADASAHASSHLVTHLEQGGVGVLMIAAPTDNGGAVPHWICITGVALNSDGTPNKWYVSDAAQVSDQRNFTGSIAHDRLMQMWQRPCKFALGAESVVEYKHFWIAAGSTPLELSKLEKLGQAIQSPVITNGLLIGAEEVTRTLVPVGESIQSFGERMKDKWQNDLLPRLRGEKNR